MIVALNLIFYTYITVTFGYLYSQKVLGTTDRLKTIAYALVIGISAFVFFVNVLAYFIYFSYAVSVVVISMAIGALLLSRSSSSPRPILTEGYDRKIIIAAFFVALSCFIITLRSAGGTDPIHVPTAATISAGNFPVRDPVAPDRPRIYYHYAPDLFAAQLHTMTGIPIWLAYGYLIFYAVFALYILLYLGAREIFDSKRSARVATFFAFFGLGLQWIYFFTRGMPTLYSIYIRDEQVFAPFSFLHDMIASFINTNFIHNMHSYSVLMGMLFLSGILLLLLDVYRTADRFRYWSTTVTVAIMLGFLALASETYFAVLIASFICLGFYFFFYYPSERRRYLYPLVVCLLVGGGIALFQGGVITARLGGEAGDKILLVHSLEQLLTIDARLRPSQPVNSFPIFGLNSFIYFGIPVIMGMYILYTQRRNPVVRFLALIALISFLPPIIFELPSRPWDLTRFFMLGTMICAYLTGGYLTERYERSKLWRSHLVIVLLAGATVASGLLTAVFYIVTPMTSFGNWRASFIAIPTAPTPLEARAYTWIAEHTTQQDYFFPTNGDFIRDTARFTPSGDGSGLADPSRESLLYTEFVTHCSVNALRGLKIKYLYMQPGKLDYFSETCLPKLPVVLVYQEKEDHQYRSIYQVLQ